MHWILVVFRLKLLVNLINKLRAPLAKIRGFLSSASAVLVAGAGLRIENKTPCALHEVHPSSGPETGTEMRTFNEIGAPLFLVF